MKITDGLTKRTQNFNPGPVFSTVSTLLSAAQSKLKRDKSAAVNEVADAAGDLLHMLRHLDPTFDVGVVPAAMLHEAQAALSDLKGKRAEDLQPVIQRTLASFGLLREGETPTAALVFERLLLHAQYLNAHQPSPDLPPVDADAPPVAEDPPVSDAPAPRRRGRPKKTESAPPVDET